MLLQYFTTFFTVNIFYVKLVDFLISCFVNGLFSSILVCTGYFPLFSTIFDSLRVSVPWVIVPFPSSFLDSSLIRI